MDVVYNDDFDGKVEPTSRLTYSDLDHCEETDIRTRQQSINADVLTR